MKQILHIWELISYYEDRQQVMDLEDWKNALWDCDGFPK